MVGPVLIGCRHAAREVQKRTARSWPSAPRFRTTYFTLLEMVHFHGSPYGAVRLSAPLHRDHEVFTFFFTVGAAAEKEPVFVDAVANFFADREQHRVFRVFGAEVEQNVIALHDVFLANGGVGRVRSGTRILKHGALQRFHLEQLASAVLFRILGLSQRREQQNRECQSGFHETFLVSGFMSHAIGTSSIVGQKLLLRKITAVTAEGNYWKRALKLALDEAFQGLKKGREGDDGGVGAIDLGVTLGPQGGDGEGHGDPVIAEGVEVGAVQFLAAGNGDAIFVFFDLGSPGTQVGGNGFNAVALLDAKFLGVADADALFGEGRDGGEHGECVDEGGGISASDFGRFQVLAFDADGAHQLAVLLFELRDRDANTEADEDVEQAGAGGIHQERVNHQLGSRKQRGGAEKEGSAGEVAGDTSFDGLQFLPTGNARGVPVAAEFR